MRAFSYAWSVPLTYDKGGGHTIRSAIAEKPMLHADLIALCFIELKLLPIEVLHCGNRNFRPFCSCDLDLDLDLDLDPMVFIYERDPYSLDSLNIQI